MASYELTGTIKMIGDVMTFGSGFTKREFVVTTEEERYPQPIKLAMVKDRCSLLDEFAVGDRVQVTFDLRGNEYKERFYVDLQAWRIQKAAPEAAPGDEDRPPLPDTPPAIEGESDSGLPF